MTSAGTTREVPMPELRVVAVSNDGTRLVLKAADGTEFSLAIDERLRAAVRGDRARLGQIEIEVESQLRPRDIQARIRAGATAEEVAQLAGIPVDRVRRFEGPVLAERAFMAERARKTPIRRQGESAGPLLGEIVTERLHLRGAESDSVQWDSWRRDDGSWEILLLYRAEGEMHSASWSFDPPRRLVTTNDDEARSLVGEHTGAPETPFPFRPRLASLPRNTGDDAITSLLDAVPGLRGESAGAGPREPMRIDVPAIGGERPRPAPVPDDDDEPEAPPAAAAAAGAAPSAGSAYENVLVPRVVGPHRDRLIGATDRQAEADGVRPGRRATVPSWDEIVFGSRRKKRE
ncbi:septation protein SepH [Yinghuangia seranimata]|uniref:septation protein SepH n=1 Tax=Yinghuangia seranimata TaxID=408067 RepID=UPI00248BA17E|nr:septation protein SepH [Yinghuangia seranimata]MDI2128700.1 septation protein SepH [Yinghuangia seranimata]